MSDTYALCKVRPGDYLWTSNDARTLWRFQRYQDGRAHGLDVSYEARWFWQAMRLPMPTEPLTDQSVDELPWIIAGAMLPTRRAAHDLARSYGP